MKSYLLIIILLGCSVTLFSQELKIKVTNPGAFERANETVEIAWTDISGLIDGSSVAVFENGKKIVSQTIDSNNDGVMESLLFQSSFSAKEEKTFVVKGGEAPAEAQYASTAKYMLPRKDVAWENDRIAYRIYGGILAGDVRSGIDVLVKSVRYPVLDKWYAGDSLKGKARVSYHVDHGEGADFFMVGKTLGGGGCALWRNGERVQSGLFAGQAILANGPLRAMFRVTYYDTLDGFVFMEEKTYTLDAGQNLNKIEVRYSALPDEGSVQVATGLVKRKNTAFSSDDEKGWFSLCGWANDDSTNGNLETGIVLMPSTLVEKKETDDHYLIIVKTDERKQMTYYAGGGWTKSGDFATDADWNAYLANFALRLRTPLKVTAEKQ